MKVSNKRGFTLIEVLVVVLIIGILAAVALPQYQKAVEKSRVSEALVLLKAIARANQVYYMTHGTYADNITDLDIAVPGASGGYNRINTQYFEYGVAHTDGKKTLALVQRRPHSQKYALYININTPNEITCEVYDSQFEWVRTLGH